MKQNPLGLALACAAALVSVNIGASITGYLLVIVAVIITFFSGYDVGHNEAWDTDTALTALGVACSHKGYELEEVNYWRIASNEQFPIFFETEFPNGWIETTKFGKYYIVPI